MSFEAQFDQLVPEDYDFDHDVITDQGVIDALIALTKAMPENRVEGEPGDQVFRGWSAEEGCYIDFYLKTEGASCVFCGSENLMG